MSSIKIDGIGKGYLNKMEIQNEYGILQRFKEIEDDIWGGDPPDKEDPTRAFIDGLINIISKIRYPTKGKEKEDAEKEVENANQLVEKVEQLTEEIIISEEISRKTTADIVEGLKKKSDNPAQFETFLCCLLMADSLKKNECDVFSGVFKSWNRLQKLDQIGEEELQKSFKTETAKINRNRSENVKTGFQRIISLISEDGNKALEMGKLHSFCLKEEAIRDKFYKLFTNCKITRPKFARCYASVKKLLPEFDKITEMNDNLEHHLEWEVKEMRRVFGLSPPSFETENGTNRLQKQLANLWNQVKNKLNDPEKEWKQFTESESPKVTTPDDVTDRSSNHDELKCLQINLNRSKDAWEELIHQWLAEEKVDVVFIQEPCLKKIGNEQTNDCCYYFPGLPKNYRAVHNNYLMGEDKKSEYDRSAAILVHDDVPFERIPPMAATTDKYTHPQELMAGIRLTGNGWDGVTLFSIYCRPSRSLALLLKPLSSLGNHDMTRTVFCMDANATHPNWSLNWEDNGFYSGRGEDLENFQAFCKLQVANKNLEDKSKPIKTRATKENEGDTSDEDKTETNNVPEKNSKHIDVTLYGTKLRIKEWERLEGKSSSDHRYIIFSIFRKKCLPEIASELTKQITERRPWEFTLDRKNLICSGSFFAVFRGPFNGEKIAIKRVRVDRIKFQEKEEKIIGQLDHPNVIKLLQVTQDVDFRFYVFELAAGTVDDFCDRIYRGKMPSDAEALKQMATGLLYIHGKQFAHLNIKPSSVYISTSEPVRLMIAKFGSCEATTDTGTFSIGYDNESGAAGWMAPEILKYFDHFGADSDDDEEEPEPDSTFSIACDTWSLGCLFFYFLKRGIHPYGEDDGREDDDTIRWNIVVEQNPAELKAMQASNHEDNQIYELIRDMIETKPEKRIPLETVVMRLETLFPPSATSQEYKKDDQPTQDGNDESSQNSGSTSQDIEKGNVYQTTVSGGLPFENIEEVEGKTPDAQEKDDDKSDKTKLKEEEEGKCCIHCDKKFNEIKKTMEELSKFKVINATKELRKSVGNAHEKLGHLNESAIRSNLRSNERGEARNISSLHQLVKCYGEAQDEDWTETDTIRNCKRVVKHLKAINTENEFLNWYYEEANNHLLEKEPGLIEKIKKLFFLDQEGNSYSVVKFYTGGKLQNYISGPIRNWNDYHKLSGPIFLLALYQSIKDKPDLLSFPPPGLLTMDDPVKISRAISSVHIEVGEIKSSDEDKVIKNAKLQLRRSLLCFKWLDELLSHPDKFKFSYGLIGNIFINDNCSATQKKSVTGKRKVTDYLQEEGICFKYKYKIYK